MKNMEVEIKTPYIKLGDLLKFSGYVVMGSEAKMLILQGDVKVNGEVCTMRGKKIVSGDIVTIDETTINVKNQI